jgi:phosphohistidine phosphatase
LRTIDLDATRQGFTLKFLYLLRHGKSSWDAPATDDFDRPLNARGREASTLMGEYMERAGIHPALILCSAARRTRETMDLVADALQYEPVVRLDDDLYLASRRQLLKSLRRVEDEFPSVLMIGHNPGMEKLALDLAGGGDDGAMARVANKFPTAALAVLTTGVDGWDDIGSGSCRLEAFIRPKHLREDAV